MQCPHPFSGEYEDMANQDEDKNTSRTILLLLVTALLAVASVVLGFYLLRNTLADSFAFIYFARGTELSRQDAAKLEQDLKSDLGSFADRIELLAFYSFKTYKDGLTPEDLANRREHILWIIEHEPVSNFASTHEAAFDPDGRDPEGLQQGQKLWLEHVQARPTSARILYNAGQFFFWANDWTQSEELLERAYAIEPKNHDIASSLAGLYWRDARHSLTHDQVTSMAAKSLKVFEQALSDTHDPRNRLNDLPEAAQAAFEAGEYDRAAAYSREGLSLAERPAYVDSNADAIHYGNIVLGRIAVRQGNVATASAYLLKAATIKGNPHLDTFGPNMMLAKELLEKGERKSVVEYFDRCGKFWKDDDGKLSQWRSSVLSGSNPDFGANLRY
jgi:tetratricopeptide (TPR) repeat protein